MSPDSKDFSFAEAPQGSAGCSGREPQMPPKVRAADLEAKLCSRISAHCVSVAEVDEESSHSCLSEIVARV